MRVEIDACVIEREDGPMFCGILFYSTEQRRGDVILAERYVPWSVDLTDPRQVVLKLFPADAKHDFDVVKYNYQRMADVIVDTVIAARDD